MKNTKNGHGDGHKIPRDPILDQYQSLRDKTEKKLKTMPDMKINLGPEGTRRVIHDIQVYQIAFEMQNEELSRSQIELETSRANYKDLYNYAPVDYVTIDETDLIREANLTVANLLGIRWVDLINHPLSQFILPKSQDIYFNMRKQLLVTGKTQRCELQIYRCLSTDILEILNKSKDFQDSCHQTIHRVTYAFKKMRLRSPNFKKNT